MGREGGGRRRRSALTALGVTTRPGLPTAWRIAMTVAGCLLVASCVDWRHGAPEVTARGDAPLFLVEKTGGDTTARALRGRPFHQSARNLDNAGLARFAAGAEPFDQRLADPDSEGPLDPAALGPTFVSDGCLGCHLDGTTPHRASATDTPPGFIVRVSGANGPDPITGGPAEVPGLGLVVQTRAVAGAAPAGTVRLRWVSAGSRTLPDGTKVALRRPDVAVGVGTTGTPPAGGMLVSPRMGIPIVGLGLLEAIPEADLRAAAASQAAAGHVSGRVNEVWDDLGHRLSVGRFGWKAGQPTVRQQTAHALAGDMGVTSDDTGGPAEISASAFADMVFYNRTIAVPIARRVDDPKVRRGAQRFVDVGCAACHTTTQRSGADEIDAVADESFHPYTDLLLHDMGEGLADGRPEFGASGREWRTAPLWGIGRRAEVLGFDNFLHDGRARSLLEAVEWHDGEARSARLAFERLPAGARAELLAFLASL